MRWLIACLVALPTSAFAHASERMVILTLPTGWYMLGAAIAILLTAALGLAARKLPALAPHRLFERPVLISTYVTSWLSALAFWGLVAVGHWGSRDPLGNLLPLMVWTVVWVGLTLACVVLGNVWRDIQPWSGPVRTVRKLLGLTGGIGLRRLGYWPAVAGYLGFAWFEIVSLSPADPVHLARVAAVYYCVIFVLAVAEGEDWPDKGDFLSAYFGFIARIAPFWAIRDGSRLRIMTGLPGTQVLMMAPLNASAIAFVTLVLATVSFDGLTETFWWLAQLGINPLEFPGRSAVLVTNSFAMLAFWALSAGLILGAIRLGLRGGQRFGEAAGPMMLSFLPIAAGYHVAHYLTALLTNGQYAIAALDDPFGKGWNLLGLPDHWVSFGFLATRAGVQMVWTAQFAVILGAHLLAVLLSLKVSARLGIDSGWRAHLPMTVLMVVYTVFGLWLLSSPTAG